nr:uncharacterized protein LOC111415594 [Onthophagus taurus]
MDYSVQQRVFCVETYIRSNSIEEVRRAFRRQFNNNNRGHTPNRKTVKLWVRHWRENGSVQDLKKPGRRRTIRTPENIERVRIAFTRSPKRSANRQSLILGISKGSLDRIIRKDLKFHPYKYQMAQHLSNQDKEARLAFCQEFLDLHQGAIHNLLMSDEANFYLNGMVNKQNFRYWSNENPREIFTQNLHNPKVIVWCGVGSFGIIGPYFFEDENNRAVTVTSERYVNMLETFLIPELNRRGLLNNPLLFQQDGATAHTARNSMRVLREIFNGRLISRFGDLPWPSRSPDLTAPDFFLWGYLKAKVFASRPGTIEELKVKIREEVEGIDEGLLRRVMNYFLSNIEKSVEVGGGQLEDVIFKS